MVVEVEVLMVEVVVTVLLSSNGGGNCGGGSGSLSGSGDGGCGADNSSGTVEPHSTDTRLIRTLTYNGQFRLSTRQAHLFSLKITPLIRTPVNTDDRHFSVSRVTNSRISSTPLYAHFSYLRSFYD